MQEPIRQAKKTPSQMLQKHVEATQLMNEDDSSSKTDRVSERNELLNKLLNKSTIITSFSARPEHAHILRRFREIARREAGSRSFSTTILKALEEYVHRHEAGNPQLKLTPYVDATAESPMRVLCSFIDGALSDGTLHCRKAGLWIKGIRCYSCNHNRLRKHK